MATCFAFILKLLRDQGFFLTSHLLNLPFKPLNSLGELVDFEVLLLEVLLVTQKFRIDILGLGVAHKSVFSLESLDPLLHLDCHLLVD